MFKNQSTIEMLILISGIVLVVLFIGMYIYNGSYKLNENIINLTKDQFNIFGFDFYYSTTGNYIYGSYYQTGSYTYGNAIIGIYANNTSYEIPVSTSHYVSTTGALIYNFNSSVVPQKLSSYLENGDVLYVLKYIQFESNGQNFIFVANQSGISKLN